MSRPDRRVRTPDLSTVRAIRLHSRRRRSRGVPGSSGRGSRAREAASPPDSLPRQRASPAQQHRGGLQGAVGRHRGPEGPGGLLLGQDEPVAVRQRDALRRPLGDGPLACGDEARNGPPWAASLPGPGPNAGVREPRPKDREPQPKEGPRRTLWPMAYGPRCTSTATGRTSAPLPGGGGKLGTCDIWNGEVWCGEKLASILKIPCGGG